MDGITFPEILAGVAREIETLNARLDKQHDPHLRTPSRFVEDGADLDIVKAVAEGRATLAPGAPTRSTLGVQGARGGGLALGLKALAEGTGSSGGYLVAPEISSQVMTLIRARSAVMRMGPTVVPVMKELDVTSISGGATAYYTAENAAIPTSEQTFAQAALLKPMDLDALVPVSLRLLKDAASNPSVENVIRSDLAEVIALRADLAFLQGVGTTEPLGIKNWGGLTAAPNLGANGRTPTYDDLFDCVAALRDANAPFLAPGWILAPRTLSTLEKVKDANGRYLKDTGLLTIDAAGGGGTLLGYRFVTSTQVPKNLTVGTSTNCSYIVFSSDWSEAWVGEEQSLRIDVSGDAAYTPDGGTTWVSAFQNKQMLFRATTCHDFALRRPEFFTVLAGVRP